MADYVPFTGQLDSEKPSGFVAFTGQLDEPKPPKGRDLRDELVRQLGLTARAGITGVTGVGGAIADAGVGAANLFGANLPMPSQAMQKQLTKMGLPEPSGGLEQAVQLGGSMVAGGMDPALAGISKAVAGMVPKGFQSAQASKADVVQELNAAGIKLPPTEMGGGKVSRAAEGFGGTSHVATAAKNANQPVLQKLAASEVGLAPGNLTDDALRTAAQAHIKEGYDPVKQLPLMRTGKLYRDALDDIAQKYHPKSFPTATTPQLVEDLNSLRVGGFLPKEALTKVEQLREKAGAQFGPGGDPTYGRALRDMAKAIEDQIERGLGAPQRKVTAAIRDGSGQIYTANQGSTHLHVLSQNNIPAKGREAGFIDGQGNWLTRDMADKIVGTGDAATYNQQLKGGTELLNKFRHARTELAKNYAVRDMLVDPNTGLISSAKAAQQLDSGVPLSGKLRTIAKAGSKAFVNATDAPLRGEGTPFNLGDSLYMTGGLGIGGLGGFLAGGPTGAALAGAATSAAMPALRSGARSAVLSEPVQRMLAQQMGGQPSMFGPRMGIGAISPLFTQGEE